MISSLVALTLLSAAPSRDVLERTVRDRFEAVGRSALPIDPSLSRAADELARRALTHGVEDATSLLRVTAAISRQKAWDPNPVVVALRAPTDSIAVELAKQDLGSEPSSHVGLGFAEGKERSAVIILLAKRRIELEAFPRGFAKTVSGQRVCGTLVAPLTTAELFVTRPEGSVERLPMNKATKDDSRCSTVDFPTKGRHAVEVLGNGPRGPEVAALFFVDVGPKGVPSESDDAMAEPEDDTRARAMLVTRINALRMQLGVTPVQPDSELEAVAQAWADRLAKENFFSHVAPEGSTLKQRLTEAGYKFASAGENLGLSSGPLAAHFGIEHSPGHRNNLLEPGHRKIGLGLATRSDGLRVLVEVLAAPINTVEEKDPIGTLYASIAAERKRRKLSPLRQSTVLESLAQAHVRKALELDTPKAELPNQPRLHERAFETMDELASVSVDVFISDTPRLGSESKNLGMADNTVVGVGLVKGDSARFGPGRYWIVVIYGVVR
ncbi:MAG: CAP domain-containing protein [Archangium sp.]|nr:CAP domain-containing protein [Archangium sp.]